VGLRYINSALLLAAMLLPATVAFCQQQDPPAPPTGATGSTGRMPMYRRSYHPPPDGMRPDGMPPGPPPNGMRGGGPPDGRGRGPGGPPHNQFPPFFDQLAKMPAEDREKALAADRHFHRMPPDRQPKVRENLDRFANMTPEQQKLLRDRFQIVASMPPENRDRIREVFPRWKKLPEDRRQAMREELHTLTAMTPADREKHFATAEFQKTYSPQEQQLLKDLAGLSR
jgi:hypothetical protein